MSPQAIQMSFFFSRSLDCSNKKTKLATPSCAAVGLTSIAAPPDTA